MHNEQSLCPAHPFLAADVQGETGIDLRFRFCQVNRSHGLQVVLVKHPRLPGGALAASQWVGLLACGALDAQVAPEQAASLIDLLWAATQHDISKARSAIELH